MSGITQPEWKPSEALQGLKEIMEKLEARPRWRVLLVEDDKDDRLAIGRKLEKHNCDVRAAENYEMACAELLVSDNEYDLCFVDMRLPGPDGIEVIRRVKPQKPAIRFVIISGYDIAAIMERVTPLGIITVMAKDKMDRDLEYLFDTKPG